jgi:uncharacterized protein YdaU (DUF1376 family)
MNFYPFHIGDYASATRHLSWDEDMAYRRLLDAYYKKEEPIPLDRRQAYRLVCASTPEQREAVDVVLAEFFEETAEGWRNSRCDAELEAFHVKSAKASESAKARWRNANGQRSESECNANASNDGSERIETTSEGSATNTNTNTNTKNQKPSIGGARRAPLSTRPPTLDDVRAAFMANEGGYLSADEDAPVMFDHYQARGWVRKGGAQIFSLEKLVADWIDRKEQQ